jgi:hypothetical protein
MWGLTLFERSMDRKPLKQCTHKDWSAHGGIGLDIWILVDIV